MQKANAARVDTADSRLLKALIFFKQNKNTEAMAAFDKVLELDDIQHILLTRTPAMTGRYEFLSFDNPAGGRANCRQRRVAAEQLGVVATQRECLEMLGCYGTGGVHKLAEIVAATVLALSSPDRLYRGLLSIKGVAWNGACANRASAATS